MVGCYIFTAGSIRSDLRKTEKSPEGNKELMNLCRLMCIIVPVCTHMYLCVYVCLQNSGCAINSVTHQCSWPQSWCEDWWVADPRTHERSEGKGQWYSGSVWLRNRAGGGQDWEIRLRGVYLKPSEAEKEKWSKEGEERRSRWRHRTETVRWSYLE